MIELPQHSTRPIPTFDTSIWHISYESFFFPVFEHDIDNIKYIH